MSKKETFLKKFEKSNYKKVGEFQNEYGEKFIIYRTPFLADVNLITGDELDWDEGWEVSSEGLVYQRFLISEDEIKEIRRFLISEDEIKEIKKILK